MANDRMKKVIISVFLIIAFLFVGCSYASSNNTSSSFDDMNKNYKSYLYETCNKLNEFVKHNNIEGFRTLLSNDLASEMSDDVVEKLIEFLNENEIDFNPYEIENTTNKIRVYSNEEICLFGEINYFDVEGIDGSKYNIRIQRCFYFEGVPVSESINYYRIESSTDGIIRYEYGETW